MVVGLFWSCSDSELITPGDEFLTEVESGTYTVERDGVFTDYSTVTSANSNEAASNINGANSIGESISILLPGNLALGTFTETQGAVIVLIMNDGSAYTNINLSGELLPFTVVITDIDFTTGLVSGNFFGSAYNMVSDQTISLTNGLFFEIQFEPISTADHLLQGDFNGETIDFSTDAQATGITTAALISGHNAVENQSLSITIPGGIAVGTYTEANNVVIQVNLDSSGIPGDYYTNYDATTDTYLPVTLNISSVVGTTEGSVQGTFSGEITKFVGGVPTDVVTITNGQINVPIVTPTP